MRFLRVMPAVTFGVVLMLLLALDLVVIRVSRSMLLVGLVVGATTLVGLFLVLLAPAIVLIAINLAVVPD